MIVPIKTKAVLAPMAGVTDYAFRTVAQAYGAGMVITEMVSAKGLYYGDKKTASLLEGAHSVLTGAQIFGHEPEIIAKVARKAASYGADFLDINCGCPAPKIVKNGDGAALMKDLPLLGAVVRAAAENAGVPVSVKLRSGWSENEINAVGAAKTAEENGAAMITVHGRTAKQQYSGKADWRVIARVSAAVSVPVVGNGDITDGSRAKQMLEQTGCSAVMVGRGALGNPWIFREITAALEGRPLPPPPSARERIDLCLRHIRLILKTKGEYIGIREARKHALWYIKGFRGSTAVKNQITKAKSYSEMQQLLTSLNESCDSLL